MRPDALRNLLILFALPAVLVGVGFSVGSRSRAVSPSVKTFQFAARTPPELSLGPADPAGVWTGALTQRGGWFQVDAVAVFADPLKATAAAGAVRDLLSDSARHYANPRHASALSALSEAQGVAPLTPPEAIRLAEHGITGLRSGVGWPGTADEAERAVIQLGRLVLVSGLKGDFNRLQPNPLGAYLAKLGGRSHLPGDPGVATRFAVDLSCFAGDEETAHRVGLALARYLEADPELRLRPPWHPKGVSAGEQRARETYFQASLAFSTALSAVNATPEQGRTPEEALLAEREWLAKLAGIRRAALTPLLELPDLDSQLLRELIEGPARGERLLESDPASLRLAARLGQVDVQVPDRAHALSARGCARVEGRRVDVGGLELSRFAPGIVALLEYLQREGCGDIRLALVPQ